MSAITPKADMAWTIGDVRFVPLTTKCGAAKGIYSSTSSSAFLFDDPRGDLMSVKPTHEFEQRDAAQRHQADKVKGTVTGL